nr:MAG: pTP protein [unidentified adenovirus]
MHLKSYMSSFQNALECAELTGQNIYTMELFRPLRNIWNQAQHWTRASVTAAGIKWMSAFVYKYHELMLLNLSPRHPNTLHWPLYTYPPPHFLIGYQYLVRVCNDYFFEERIFSRITYEEIVRQSLQVVNWSFLSTCKYTVFTGAQQRFIDIEDIEGTLTGIQRQIITDRIITDLSALPQGPFTGRGLLMPESSKNINIGEQEAWKLKFLGLCNSTLEQRSMWNQVQQLKRCLLRFLIYCTDNDVSSLPLDFSRDWISDFLNFFDLDPTTVEIPETLEISRLINILLSVHRARNGILTGGALTLRPREGGRAVTEEMRRRRGEIVERFIESLPYPSRRRRPTLVSIHEVLTLEEEIAQTVIEIIQALNDELPDHVRNSNFFSFTEIFYEGLVQSINNAAVTEAVLRRWAHNFFLAEHVASTLHYLHVSLLSHRLFNRHVSLNLAQVVMRSRDSMGRLLFTRLWNEEGFQSFETLIDRITRDLSTGHQHMEQGEEVDLERLLTDIDYRENSGEISEIIKQIETAEQDIDSVELSFRFKMTGPVAFTQNSQIRNINSRVVRLATSLRRQQQQLPQRNEHVFLP